MPIDIEKPVYRVRGRDSQGRRCTWFVNADSAGNADRLAREHRSFGSVDRVELIPRETIDEWDAILHGKAVDSG